MHVIEFRRAASSWSAPQSHWERIHRRGANCPSMALVALLCALAIPAARRKIISSMRYGCGISAADWNRLLYSEAISVLLEVRNRRGK
jgi:hypothetical protein